VKSIDKIIDIGCVFYSIRRDILISSRRDQPTSRIRFSIMAALREEGYSLTSIGMALQRDHGTVINGIKQVTPGAMGGLWPNHQQFLKMIALRTDLEDDPIPDVIAATKMAITEIDRRMADYTQTRLVLLNTLAALETRPDLNRKP
jgi:hypothetical protein